MGSGHDLYLERVTGHTGVHICQNSANVNEYIHFRCKIYMKRKNGKELILVYDMHAELVRVLVYEIYFDMSKNKLGWWMDPRGMDWRKDMQLKSTVK